MVKNKAGFPLGDSVKVIQFLKPGHLRDFLVPSLAAVLDDNLSLNPPSRLSSISSFTEVITEERLKLSFLNLPQTELPRLLDAAVDWAACKRKDIFKLYLHYSRIILTSRIDSIVSSLPFPLAKDSFTTMSVRTEKVAL